MLSAFILRLLFVLLVSSFGMGLLRAGDGDIIKVGNRAPAFTGVDSSGQTVSLASFKGKVVLLDFFATWCPACLEEMSRLQSEIWKKDQARGLVVLAIGREHSVAEMAKFKKAKGLGFTLVADPKREIYGKYAKEYIPRTYLISPDGVILYASADYERNEFAKMKKLVARELAAQAKA